MSNYSTACRRNIGGVLLAYPAIEILFLDPCFYDNNNSRYIAVFKARLKLCPYIGSFTRYSEVCATAKN